MATIAEVREKGEKLAKQMQRFDVNVAEYKYPPMGVDAFIAAVRARDVQRKSIKEGIIRVWPGIADIEVRGAKRHRQVVLNVTEEKRTIERRVKFNAPYVPNESARRASMLRDIAQSRFPVTPPVGREDDVKWSIKRVNVEERKYAYDTTTTWTYTYDVVATIPASENTLLTGMDETFHFIAALPERVSSVKEAHELLRPSVRKNAIRQGEWFFEPVSDYMSKRLDEAMMWRMRNGASPHGEDVPIRRGANEMYRNGTHPLENGSSHYATTILDYDGNRYAIGWAWDTRHSHHAPIWLNDWHRIVRNKEVVNPEGFNPKITRYWD